MAVKIASGLGALNSNQSSSQLVRTSTGNLYAIIVSNSFIKVYKSSDNGLSWAQKDYANSPKATATASTIAVSAAIDGNGVIQIVFVQSNSGGPRYVPFSTVTDTFGQGQRILTSTTPTTYISVSLAVDSNNQSHVVVAYNTATTPSVDYATSIRYDGNAWRAPINLSSTGTPSNTDVQIDSNNVPQATVINAGLLVYLGNKNNASSFTSTTVDTSVTSAGGSTLTIDAFRNTWAAFQSANNGLVSLYKHISTNAWATWQTAVTDGFSGKSVSLAADINDIYIFYERNTGGIAYDRYDTVNNKWLGETIIQSATPSFRPHNPFVKWSQYFNNGDTGDNNTNQQTIEYLFDDGSTVYYDKLTTAQISTGLASISFSTPPATTTTSTSSTSSSTSVSTSTSSTSSSTSTSISTSSTSSSTSISTSSTSQSTSTSISTSSTSSSTSTSLSTSTSSTSASTSVSTSSTSSSISTSTSSTSSSTSLSASSTSQSTSVSTSTSSTSSSTSISTSSTSQSTSTSLSTSSTSQSTSLSTSTSHSTSSTSQSTSTSLSTSSTSQSTSISSTSSSISTSSTSSSTSISTSSTSSSISTSTSLSTSSTSQSTSTSLSTSSTSSSTSTSITGTTTSTSSTSSSVSTSTSSTSSSTSTTMIDVNFRPRASVRVDNLSASVRIDNLSVSVSDAAKMRIRNIKLRLR